MEKVLLHHHESQRGNVLESIIHFFVHNSFLFTVAIMGLVHAVLLGIMCWAQIQPLIFFNILSVTVYLFCVLLCKHGHIMPVYVSILLEVSSYAVASVYYLGWNCGAHFFLFSIVPIIIYYGCYLFKGVKRWTIVALLAFEFSLFALLYIGHSEMKPVYAVTSSVRTVLVLFSSFAMLFAVIFYNVLYIYSSEFEVSDLESKNEKLYVDAQEDALTGLLNRRGFLPLVDNLMKESDSKCFCIAFCDIDDFKRINDSYGHDCGDEVLRHISRILKKDLQDCVICRWGGEEIVALMKNCVIQDARRKAEYVRNIIETTPTVFYNKRIFATITIGLVEYDVTYNAPGDIIKAADERMYYGKQHGKNILIC